MHYWSSAEEKHCLFLLRLPRIRSRPRIYMQQKKNKWRHARNFFSSITWRRKILMKGLSSERVSGWHTAILLRQQDFLSSVTRCMFALANAYPLRSLSILFFLPVFSLGCWQAWKRMAASENSLLLTSWQLANFCNSIDVAGGSYEPISRVSLLVFF